MEMGLKHYVRVHLWSVSNNGNIDSETVLFIVTVTV